MNRDYDVNQFDSVFGTSSVFFPISANHWGVPLYESVESDIVSYLISIRDDKFCVTLMLYGEQLSTAQPTIVVSCSNAKGVERMPFIPPALSFYAVEEQIHHYAPADAKDRLRYDHVPCGASISSNANSDSVGSFGGYLRQREVSNEGASTVSEEKSTQLYGITCFHVLATNERVAPGETISQPGKADAEHDNPGSTSSSNGNFGTFLRGECRPIEQDGRTVTLDYAIFRIDQRHGTNILDSVVSGWGFNRVAVKEIDTSILRTNTEVFKYGRTTGLTKGHLNGVKCNVRMKGYGNPVTSEWHVCGRQQPFSLDGDSGSWVITADGKLVGYILGGCSKLNISYVSSFDVVLDNCGMDLCLP